METMIEMTCGNCGVAWAMPETLYNARKRDHKTFYCPNGDPRHFPGQTREEKRIAELEKQLEKNREFQRERFHSLLEEREEWKDLAMRCPICGEKVASRLRVRENIVTRLDTHLRGEHGAVDRRRLITAA